jgi:hypothetical protein
VDEFGQFLQESTLVFAVSVTGRVRVGHSLEVQYVR